MVVVVERHEAERLKYALFCLPHWAEDLGHAAHRPGMRIKRELDKCARGKRPRQLQQAAGRRNGLQFSLSVPAVF